MHSIKQIQMRTALVKCFSSDFYLQNYACIDMIHICEVSLRENRYINRHNINGNINLTKAQRGKDFLYFKGGLGNHFSFVFDV